MIHDVDALVERSHCGANSGRFETSMIHFPMREGVSDVSIRAKRAVWSKRTSEWRGRNERTDERVAQYLHLDSRLFCPTVDRVKEREREGEEEGRRRKRRRRTWRCRRFSLALFFFFLLRVSCFLLFRLFFTFFPLSQRSR